MWLFIVHVANKYCYLRVVDFAISGKIIFFYSVTKTFLEHYCRYKFHLKFLACMESFFFCCSVIDFGIYEESSFPYIYIGSISNTWNNKCSPKYQIDWMDEEIEFEKYQC